MTPFFVGFRHFFQNSLYPPWAKNYFECKINSKRNYDYLYVTGNKFPYIMKLCFSAAKNINHIPKEKITEVPSTSVCDKCRKWKNSITVERIHLDFPANFHLFTFSLKTTKMWFPFYHTFRTSSIINFFIVFKLWSTWFNYICLLIFTFSGVYPCMCEFLTLKSTYL